MSHDVNRELGADELRIRSILKTRGVGPDATPPPVPPKPAGRPRDWLDDILDSPPEPEEETPAHAPKARRWRATTRPQPEPDTESDLGPQPTARRPRQSLLDAHAGVSPRLRWLAYHATAAGTGWWLGWVNWSTHTTAWLTDGHWTSPSAFVLYGLGACTVGLYRRARTWTWPAAWCAAVPVSSIVLGVLLYAPNQ